MFAVNSGLAGVLARQVERKERACPAINCAEVVKKNAVGQVKRVAGITTGSRPIAGQATLLHIQHLSTYQ
jgi:hypothetical protein